MFRIETIRYFLGIVPGSESERIETVFAATWLTILVSFSCFGAFVRFAAITGALGVQGAIVDVGIRLIAMITVIALSVILYQYIAALFFFLVEWLIYFPIQYIVSRFKSRDNKLSISHDILPINKGQSTPIIIPIPLFAPKEVYSASGERTQTRAMAPLLLPPPENYKFVSMLTERCTDKNGLYNEFIREEDESTITESLDFAIKFWVLAKLVLIPENMQNYLSSVPSRYCSVKRGQLSNLVRKVKKSIKEYLKAEKEGYEATEEELEIYERYIVLKNRFKVFKDK